MKEGEIGGSERGSKGVKEGGSERGKRGSEGGRE